MLCILFQSHPMTLGGYFFTREIKALRHSDIKTLKTLRSSRPEVFCKKVLLEIIIVLQAQASGY